MVERTLLVFAFLVAVSGLCILVALQPEETQGLRLRGVVVEDHGTRSMVTTNVTLIARDVKRGDVVDVPVFWGGDAFVALPVQSE